MATTSSAVKEDLMNALISKGFNPTPLDSAGNETEPENSDAFKFTFIKNGKSFGPTYVSVVDGVMTLYTNDRLEASPETNTSGSDRFTDSWTGFKKEMSKFAKEHRLEWGIDNVNHLHYDMKKRTNMKKKEKVAEGYYPLGKKASYSDNVPQVKILIQHTRQIEEGEQRYRNVARIFVENTNGERFLLPTKRPGIAKVYARHIAEGGTPYDDKGKHITSLVEEYTKMAGFVRATKNGQFNESAQRLVNEGLAHYQNLRETLSRMISQRGYHKYFDSYTPVLNEQSDEATNLNELFVQETLDPRIESVMPILVRLSKNINEMSEVKALDEWAENLVNEEVSVKYEVIDKDGKRIGHWDGIVFVPYDRSKFPAGKMDKIPQGSKVDKESGPLDDKHMAMGKAGLEEIGIGTLKSTEWQATERMKKFQNEIDRLKKIGDTANIEKYEKALQHYKDLIAKTKSHPEKMNTIRTATKLGGMMPAKVKNVAEESEEMDEGKLAKAALLSLAGISALNPLAAKAGGVSLPGSGGEFSADQQVQLNKSTEARMNAIQDLQKFLAKMGMRQVISGELDNVTYDNIMKASQMHDAGKMSGDQADMFKDLSTKAGLMKEDNLGEAPGAETLAHNQNTEEKNLKAFGLAEGPADEPVEPDMDADDKRWDDAEGAEEMNEGEATYHHIVVDGSSKGKYKDIAKAKALLKAMQERFPNKKIEIETKKEFAEDLDKNQKAAGQLGPTEKVGPKGAVGKLVGASESVESDELNRIKEMIGYK